MLVSGFHYHFLCNGKTGLESYSDLFSLFKEALVEQIHCAFCWVSKALVYSAQAWPEGFCSLEENPSERTYCETSSKYWVGHEVHFVFQ